MSAGGAGAGGAGAGAGAGGGAGGAGGAGGGGGRGPRINFILRLVDHVTGPVQGIFRLLSRPVGMLGVGGLVGGVLAAANAFGEWDANVRSLKASFMRADGSVPSSFKKLVELTDKLGGSLPGTGSDFYRLANLMNNKGISDKSLLNGALVAAANLGVVLRDNGISLDEAGEAMARFKHSLNVDDKDLNQLADTLQRIIKSGVELQDLKYGVANFASIMPALGWKGLKSGQDTAALMSMLIQATGASGDTVGTGLKALVMKLASKRNVKNLNRELASGGLKEQLQFFDKKGRFVDQEGMAREMGKLGKIKNEQALISIINKYFGAEAGNVAFAMAKKGAAGFAERKAALAEQADLDKRIRVVLDGLFMKWEAAQGAFNGLLVKAGEIVEPELKKASDKFGELSEKGAKWLEDNKPMIRSKLSSLIDSIANGIGPLIKMFKGAAASFASIFGFVETVGKYLDDWNKTYEVAPKEMMDAAWSGNPFEMIPALTGLSRIREKVREGREAIEAQRASDEAEAEAGGRLSPFQMAMFAGNAGMALAKLASWKGFKDLTTPGKSFGQFKQDRDNEIRELIDYLKSRTWQETVKIVVELDPSGMLKIKEQVGGGLQAIERRIYNGKNMPQAGG